MKKQVLAYNAHIWQDTRMENKSSEIQWIDSGTFEHLYPFKRRTFFQWIAEGKLTAYRFWKKKTLVKREEIEKVLEGGMGAVGKGRIVGRGDD